MSGASRRRAEVISCSTMIPTANQMDHILGKRYSKMMTTVKTVKTIAKAVANINATKRDGVLIGGGSSN